MYIDYLYSSGYLYHNICKLSKQLNAAIWIKTENIYKLFKFIWDIWQIMDLEPIERPEITVKIKLWETMRNHIRSAFSS